MLVSSPFYYKRPGTIYTINTGGYLQSICTNSVTMAVSVVGDLTNHIITWEQVGGSSLGINFITPLNDTTVTYINSVPPGQYDDKIFRFWIDKGTNRAIFADVYVYGSPTDKINITTTQANILSNNQYTGTEPTLNVVFAFPIYGSTDTIYTFTDSESVITWTFPVTPYLYYELQYSYDNSTWQKITLPQIYYDNWMYANPTSGIYYRIIAYYNIDKVNYKLVSESLQYFDNVNNNTISPHISDTIFTIDVPQSQKLNTCSSYNVLISTLLQYPINDSFTISSDSQSSNKINIISNYNTSFPSLETIPTNIGNIDLTNSNLSNIKANYLTNYTVLQASGVHIGG